MESFALEDHKFFDKRQYQRQYNASDKGKESRKKYRHDKSKHTTDAVYLSRRIVAIDGEGINVRRGRHKGEHFYVMLALSGVAPIVDEHGLSTEDCLQYLWDNLDAHDINVIFGGSYDFNCWLKDLEEDELRYLYSSSYTSTPLEWRGFRLRWIKGKGFEIGKHEKTVVINDVISFFQRPFIQACDEYLGDSWIGRDTIVREKARRGNFTFAEIVKVIDYNAYELDRLVDLVTELRSRLNRVGLRPRRWNSPGAIASALFLREKVKQHRNENIPEAVARAGRFAYAGGRFEMIRYGCVVGDVYEYDINSAYPCAMLELPSLIGGTWTHWEKGDNPELISAAAPFALYKVRFTGSDPNIPAPVFVRGEKGTIAYPLNAESWIWSPEYEALQQYVKQVPGTKAETLEIWEYRERDKTRPFSFIAELYKKRQVLKAAGDGAHIGIKLALNSLYGKLAQQVGWIQASMTHPVRVPTYHQLEWAGYITSWCRAHILKAALLDLDSVIAFETDALFTTRPLPLNIGTGLGEWEETHFTSLTYVQSGHYYGTKIEKGEEVEVVKCRGIDKGFVSRKNVEDMLNRPEGHRVLEAQLTRFYGAGIALARGLDKYWRRWLTEPKYMQLLPTGKRMHGACDCEQGGGLELGIWHKTYCPVWGGRSHEYPVEWINPNPDMTELTEMRETEKLYESA